MVEEKAFNAVIEGTAEDNWGRLQAKLARLDVPPLTAVLADGTFRYQLCGITADFETIQPMKKPGTLEVAVEPLATCPGIVLPHDSGMTNVLPRPRAVFLRDGRVFVDPNVSSDPRYSATLPIWLIGVRETFIDSRYELFYLVVASRNRNGAVAKPEPGEK